MITNREYLKRLISLQKLISDNDLDCFIVSSQENIYYLTGATYKPLERPFFIIVRPSEEPIFLVPKLEEQHMMKAAIGKTISYWEFPAPEGLNWYDKLAEIIRNCKKIGIEPSLPVQHKNILLKNSFLKDIRMTSMPLVEKLRIIKSPPEIEMIKIASNYAVKGMKLIFDNAYFGASVLEMFSLSKDLQIEVIKKGNFTPLDTEFLTACWPAPFSALPHGIPKISDKLKDGPIVGMSFHRINGYAAECERTFFLKDPTNEEKEFFEIMITAREKALSEIRADVYATNIDNIVSDYLKDMGMKKYLLHRTGHGIGLGNHEAPWIAEGSSDILKENMVISIEPGIYIPEIGGFRHSDTVLVKKNGYEILTNFPTDLKSMIITKKRLLKKVKGKMVQKVLNLHKYEKTTVDNNLDTNI